VVTQAVVVRPCEERDLAHFGSLGSARHVQYCRDQFARGAAALTILVALDSDDVPLGKVHLDFEARANEGAAVLVAASVRSPARNRGIGTELMLAAEVFACGRGCRAILLGVEDTNPRARRLYERLGYCSVGTGDFAYPGAPEPNPGSWMRKDLQC
jgi:ribosomal protein S18 acetylase RimI-like enzyme